MKRTARGGRALGSLVAIPLLLGLAGSAQAATLSKQAGGRIAWSSSGPTTNQVVDIERNFPVFGGGPATYSIQAHTEATHVLADSGCTPAGDQPAGTFISCPGNIPGILLDLWNGNDTVRNAFCSPGLFCLGQSSIDIPVEIWGRDGNDNLETGSGNDIVSGNPGNDTLTTGSGNDQLDVTGPGDPAGGSDSHFAGAGNDLVVGGEGNDIIVPGTGDDGTVDGGAGIDTVSYDDGRSSGVSVTLNDGTAQTDGGVDDGAAGSREAVVNVENLTGSAGADALFGSPVANTILGRAGDDTIRGGLGTDVLRADAGRDTLDYGDRTGGQPVTVTLDGVVNDGAQAPSENDDIGTDFEVVSGGSGDDQLFSSVANSELRGQDGNDQLFGSHLGTRLFGQTGNDRVVGGEGADVLGGGLGDDSLDPRGAPDEVFGDEGADTIEARDGAVDAVNCGADTDTAFTDASDARNADCELPAPPPPPPPPPGGSVLQTPSVDVSYKLLRRPTRTTSFRRLRVSDVPPGSKLVGRCLTKRGTKCKGKLGKRFTKNGARGTVRVRAFERKNYPAGSRLEFAITNPAFVTQFKIVKMVRNRRPAIATRCSQPGSSRRGSC